jgi:hypothetical protein
MSNLIHTRPTDEVFAALVASGAVTMPDGTLDAAYSLADLTSGNPGKGALWTTDHATILIDHGSAVSVALAALIHTNLRSTISSALFQRNATNSWGSPTVNVTIPTYDADLDGLRRNSVLVRSDTALRWTRIVLSGNGVNLRIGQLALYAASYQLAINIKNGAAITSTYNTVINRTLGGLDLATERGVRQWTLDAAVDNTNAAGLLVHQAWQQCARGKSRPFVCLWDGDNEAWFARFTDDALPRTAVFMQNSNLPVRLTEVSRGQVWP